MKYITVKEAAEAWGVAPRTVRSWIERGKLPEAQRIGRDWLVPSDAAKPSDRRYVKKPVRNRRKKEPQ